MTSFSAILRSNASLGMNINGTVYKLGVELRNPPDFEAIKGVRMSVLINTASPVS